MRYLGFFSSKMSISLVPVIRAIRQEKVIDFLGTTSMSWQLKI